MKNFSIGDNGDLIRNSDYKVIRKNYKFTFQTIENRHQLRATIRAGGTAWPGGYPIFLLFGDVEPCCFDCANREYARIARDMKDGSDSSFRIIGAEINYENDDLYCAHCNIKIESAYGEEN